jgi:fimbrial isopeptide formation D2 family protein
MSPNMKKQLISAILGTAAGVLVILLTTKAVAGAECTTQYGNGQYGEEVCVPTEIAVDKQVRNPVTGVFVENLLSGDAAYSPGSEVVYRLVIKNNDTVDFSEVMVKDTLPEKLTSGRVADENKDEVFEASYNSDTRELTFKIKDLKAGEGREVTILATVLGSGSFTDSLTCDIDNRARVEAEGKSDEDNSKICVVKDVLGVTTLPQAGPEDVIPYLPFIGTGLTGIALMLKKKRA